MITFPNKINIKIVDSFTHSSIRIPNIIVMIHIFAMEKNDYHLGPFFSNDNGEIEIDKNTLEILAEAELESGLMDYRSVKECSPLVEIGIISEKDIENLIKGRELWGVSKREKELYGSSENLLNRIKKSNNHAICPNSLRVMWGRNTQSEISYKLLTCKKEKIKE